MAQFIYAYRSLVRPNITYVLIGVAVYSIVSGVNAPDWFVALVTLAVKDWMDSRKPSP